MTLRYTHTLNRNECQGYLLGWGGVGGGGGGGGGGVKTGGAYSLTPFMF